MNLTKDRVNALEGYLSAPDIALPSEEKEAHEIATDLIAYWKSRQPKVCRHCGFHRNEHVPDGSFLQCYNKYGTPLETTYKE